MEKCEKKKGVEEELSKKDPYPAPLVTDLPQLSSTLDLHHALTDQDVARMELVVKKISLKRQYLGCDWDWHQLDIKKHSLGTQFRASNHTIKENKASMSRFREIIREKAKDKTELSDQIFMAKLEIEQYKGVVVEMERYVNQYSVYEKFLELVAQDAPEFNSVGDVLNRFESLEATRKECLRTLERELGEATALRRQMTDLVELKSAKLKNLANNLVTLQLRSKHAEVRRRYWERSVGRLRGQLMGGEAGRLELAGGCWDLYRQMCARRRVPAADMAAPHDIVQQLDYIQQTIMFYKEVNTIAVAAKQAREKTNKPTLDNRLLMESSC